MYIKYFQGYAAVMQSVREAQLWAEEANFLFCAWSKQCRLVDLSFYSKTSLSQSLQRTITQSKSSQTWLAFGNADSDRAVSLSPPQGGAGRSESEGLWLGGGWMVKAQSLFSLPQGGRGPQVKVKPEAGRGPGSSSSWLSISWWWIEIFSPWSHRSSRTIKRPAQAISWSDPFSDILTREENQKPGNCSKQKPPWSTLPGKRSFS